LESLLLDSFFYGHVVLDVSFFITLLPTHQHRIGLNFVHFTQLRDFFAGVLRNVVRLAVLQRALLHLADRFDALKFCADVV